MTHIERYTVPLSAAYLKITDNLPRSTKNEYYLQLAVKEVKDTAK